MVINNQFIQDIFCIDKVVTPTSPLYENIQWSMTSLCDFVFLLE